MLRILLVEDDAGIGRVIVKGLEAEDFEVEWHRAGRTVADALKAASFNLVILDLMLPDIDGVLLARQIRLSGHPVPILMLTARAGLEEKLEGFRSGADDYLTKPFHFEELLARALALARRGSAKPDPAIASFGPLVVDQRAHEACISGQKIDLTRREFELLAFMARHAGMALTRDEILLKAWSGSQETTLNAVDVYVGYLRKKLAAFPDAPSIVTLRGVGYKLVFEKVA